MWFMSKLEIIALSGVMYKVKRTGLSTYESMTLSDSVFIFLRIGSYFANKKKTKFEPGHLFHTNQKLLLLM